MQHLQPNKTTLFNPNLHSQEDLYHLSEWLAQGLPGRPGNVLLLLKTGIPTPSAKISLPRPLRKRLQVQLYLDVGPGKNFLRHDRPRTGEDVKPNPESGGPVYRLHVSKLPIPHKHQVFDRVGL